MNNFLDVDLSVIHLLIHSVEKFLLPFQGFVIFLISRTLNSAWRSFSLCSVRCAASSVSRLGGLPPRTLSRLANRVIDERMTPLIFFSKGMAEESFALIFDCCFVKLEI